MFLTNLKYLGIFRPIPVFETTAIIRTIKFTVFSSGSFCQIYRVTDEALIAESMVWSNFLLMNVFFALKGSKLFTIIHGVAQSEVYPRSAGSDREFL